MKIFLTLLLAAFIGIGSKPALATDIGVAMPLAFRNSDGNPLPQLQNDTVTLYVDHLARIRVTLYALHDRQAIANLVRNRQQTGLNDIENMRLLATRGKIIWQGNMATGLEHGSGDLAIPVAALAGGLSPGFYVVTAHDANATTGNINQVASWFAVGDLRLISVGGADGTHFYALRQSDGKPVANAALRLTGRDNAALAQAVTDDYGYAFVAALPTTTADPLRTVLGFSPDGAPALLAFNAPPTPAVTTTALMLFDRSSYQPGDMMNATLMLANVDANAMAPRLRLLRPDGLVMEERPLSAGLQYYNYRMPDYAARGQWRAEIRGGNNNLLAEQTLTITSDTTLPTPAEVIDADTAIAENFYVTSVPAGQNIAADSIATFQIRWQDKKALALPLTYALVEEQRQFNWQLEQGQWRHQRASQDKIIQRGNVIVDTAQTGTIVIPVSYGHYRLDIIDDHGVVLAKKYFQAGAMQAMEADSAAVAGLQLAVTQQPKKFGDKAKILVATPWPAAITMVLADQRVRRIINQRITPTGATVAIAVDEALAPGAFGINVVATATEIIDTGRSKRTPRQAQKTIWLPLPNITTAIQLVAPEKMPAGSEQIITLQVPANLLAPNTQARLLATPITAATTATTPLQTYARRALPPRILLRSNDGAVFNSPGQPPDTLPTLSGYGTSMLSPITTLNDHGVAQLPVTLPSETGKVLLHALVWNGEQAQDQTQIITTTRNLLAPTSTNKLTLRLEAGVWQQQCAAVIPPNEHLSKSALQKLLSRQPIILGLSPVMATQHLALLRRLPQLTVANMAELVALHDALHGWQSIPGDLPLAREILAQRRNEIFNQVMKLQRHDGGFAASPKQTHSDLASSAAALLVMTRHDAPPALAIHQTLEWLKNRLHSYRDNSDDLEQRAYALYALAESGHGDHASLRYFIEQFGNQARQAISEAHLTLALATNDPALAEEFRTRAWAQWPRLLRDEPLSALHILAILATDKVASFDTIRAAWMELDQQLPSSHKMSPVMIADYNSTYLQLLQRAGDWDYALGDQDRDRVLGMRLLPLPKSNTTLLPTNLSAQPLYACVLSRR